MRAAAPSALSAGLDRFAAAWAAGQRLWSSPPEKTEMGCIMLVTILPITELQKHSLRAAFCSAFMQSLLQMLPAPAAGVGAVGPPAPTEAAVATAPGSWAGGAPSGGA